MKEKKEKPFYGWIIAVCCFFLIGTLYTIIGNLVNLFIKPLSEGLQVSRGAVGIYVMIAALTSVAGCAVTGKLIQKYSLRLVTTIGAICGGGGYIAMAYATSLVQVYAISVFLGISIATATMIPVNLMISNWFEKKRGTVTGIVFTSAGFGGFIFTQIISYFLENYTYRQAYLVCGIIMLVVTLPITLFFIKLTPEEVGQTAYGADKGSEQKEGASEHGFKMKEVKKSSSFVSYIITILLLAIVGVGLVNQFLAHLSDNGYSVAEINVINSVFMIGLIITKPVIGILLDKKGSVFTFTLCSVGYIITILLLGVSREGNMLLPISAMVFLSFAASITSTGPSYITGELYGRTDFGTIYGVVLMVYNFGTAISSPIAGIGYDLTGSYTCLGILFLILIIVMLVTIRIAKSNVKKIVSGV